MWDTHAPASWLELTSGLHLCNTTFYSTINDKVLRFSPGVYPGDATYKYSFPKKTNPTALINRHTTGVYFTKQKSFLSVF